MIKICVGACGAEISKSENVIVAMQKLGRDRAARNFAEDAHDERLALLPMSHQGLNSGESSKACVC
jgi:hypothetical protein